MGKSQVMCVGCDNPAGKQDAESDGFCEECIAFATDRATPVAAQAGDEPMLLDAVATKVAEFYPQSTPFDMEKNRRLARAILLLPLQRDARDPAAQVSPRATGDVERVALEFAEQLVRMQGYVEIWMQVDHACAECIPGGQSVKHGFQCGYHQAKSYIATTKPGA